MIFEYALEPKLVSKWGKRENCRFFIDKFGLGEGRLVSRYPKKWKRHVWKAFEDQASGDIERTRLTELVARISETMVKRYDYAWEEGKEWIDNAVAENRRFPFHAILAKDSVNGAESVVSEDEIYNNPLFMDIPRGLCVNRNAADIVHAVSSLLKCSSVIILVDPHFGPENPRHRILFQALMRELTLDRPGKLPVRIEVLLKVKSSADFFRRECASRLPAIIPRGITVKLSRLKERGNSERLHNRYILTDIGGLSLGVGLDVSRRDINDTDDINILDKRQYRIRWEQYASDAIAFDYAEGETPIVIQGEWRI
jgi:hypothetical protein